MDLLEQMHEKRFTPERCAVCLDDAWEKCSTCLCWLCDRHAVMCSQRGCSQQCPDGAPRYCLECALDLEKHPAALYPPYTLVDGKWYCENCVDEADAPFMEPDYEMAPCPVRE